MKENETNEELHIKNDDVLDLVVEDKNKSKVNFWLLGSATLSVILLGSVWFMYTELEGKKAQHALQEKKINTCNKQLFEFEEKLDASQKKYLSLKGENQNEIKLLAQKNEDLQGKVESLLEKDSLCEKEVLTQNEEPQVNLDEYYMIKKTKIPDIPAVQLAALEVPSVDFDSSKIFVSKPQLPEALSTHK